MPNTATSELIRFDSPAATQAFIAMDDRVMGGVSRSRVRYDPAGHAVFEGTVSLENNGGFASVRGRLPQANTEDVRALQLEVMGDGKRYKIALRMGDNADGVSYQAVFSPQPGTWQTLELPLAAFTPTFRGRDVAAPPLDWRSVRQIGLLISDRQQGNFALKLRRISTLTGTPAASK